MDTPMGDGRNTELEADASDVKKSLPLSDKEKRILELYDRLLEVEVELALTRARQDATIDLSEQVTQESIKKAQERLLEARASWVLRNKVVENVMMVSPIIKAVHRGTDASPIERDLLPHVEQRDEVDTTIVKQDTERQRINDESRKAQVEAIRVSRRNAELAAEVLTLAHAADQNRAESTDDPAVMEEMSRLEKELKTSRQRWKVMKGTASAVVAGSGIDWVKDAELRDIVLDPD